MVRELEPGSLVEATFAVTRKVRRLRKDGRAYLDIELADRSGRVRARVWEAVELLDSRFDSGDTVRVLGRVGSYEGKVELELRDVERLPDGDPLELVPGARRDVDDLDGYLDFLIAEIHDDELRAVVEGILSDAAYRARFRAAAATESGHHAYAGGLIEHTVAVTALCRETAQWQPGLDTDVLTAAALLHDCGTPDALADGPVIRPSAEGLALGHVHTGLRRIEACGSPDAPAEGAPAARCSRASRRTTARPRGAASRARRPSRCTPRTPSTHESPRRAARSASSRRASGSAGAGGDAEPDRAGDAGAREAAVAAGVLLEVLLVVLLGRVERAGLGDLGRDLPAMALGERRLVGVARRDHDVALLGRRPVDRRAVLGADVVALPHALGGVVLLPEGAQQLGERQLGGR